MRTRALVSVAMTLAALSLMESSSSAQVVTASTNGTARRASASEAELRGDPLNPVRPEDYGKWERLGLGALSPLGDWLAVPISRVNEKNELRIHRTDRDEVIVVSNGGRVTFTEDGGWGAYSIGVSKEEREKLEKAKKPVRSRMGLINLETGDTTSVADVSAFTFSADGAYVAMKRYKPEGSKSKAKGVNLVIRPLDEGPDVNLGSVSEYEWADEGALIALVVDADGKVGNGVQIYDAANGRLRTLDSEPARYKGLVWMEDRDNLAVLREVLDEGYEDTTHVALAWRGLSGGSAAGVTLDPSALEGFPVDTRIVDYRALRWSDDGEILYLGVKERRKKEGDEEKHDTEKDDTEADSKADEVDSDAEGVEADSEKPDAKKKEMDPPGVQIWHAKDVEVVPQQKVRVDQHRRENYLAAWHIDDGRVVELGSELTETVSLVDGDRWAIGMDGTPYDLERMFGPVYRDVYRIDVDTGEREIIRRRVEFSMGASPGGRYFLYFEDDHFWTVDLATGEIRNLTEGIPTSFVNEARDIAVAQKPPHRIAGWTENDEAILLHDRWDVWEVALDGSSSVRLTRGAEADIRHRYVRTDPEQDFIDRNEPLYMSMYGEWSKKSGYARIQPGGIPEPLVWEDSRVGRLTKARSAERFVFTTERFDDSPDYFASGADFAHPRQVTATNPFQSEYAWGHAELVDYENAWGRKLQATLRYPADYEPGKKYPMIVYIYELRSQNQHVYSIPSERSPYNDAVFTAEGYFVLQPDIVYRDRDPGVSAVAAIEPAVAAAVATGLIDGDRVGLVGHSWGGYQTTFFVTQSDIFAAAVAGAPLTNLFSMYLSMYWNSGGTDARIFEISQGRMEVPFWEDEDAYRRNSPVFSIENMNTPLLMAFGTEDGAVEFNQGVEFYNAARRARKDFALLVYEGENHGLRKEPNQVDYHHRILDWFGHYLKGDEAPKWITEGVPYLEQERMTRKKDQEKEKGS